MTVLRYLLASMALVLTGAALADTAPAARVIVKLKSDSSLLVDTSRAQALSANRDGADPSRMHRLGVKAGLTLTDGKQLSPRMHVAHASGLSSEALAAQLSRQADVEYAVVDQPVHRLALPNDPLLPASASNPYVLVGQWYLNAPDGTTPAAINAVGAWDHTFGLSTVTVAVLDTGVRLDHEDMAGKFLNGYNMISSAANAGNSVGRSTDPSDLGDYLTQAEKTADPADFSSCTVDVTSTWHGTQVSGIVGAATNNGLGIAGVGGNTTILPVRVLGKCGGYTSDIIAAMRWAAGLSVPGVSTVPSRVARVINLSLGSSGSCSQAYQDAVTEVTATGAVVVVAAGNHTSGQSDAVESPANCSGVIAVGALRHTGTKVGYSAVGSTIAISAPGGNCVNATGTCLYPILTASNTGTQAPVTHANGGSTYTNSTGDSSLGTSFSAPMVSGTVALMLAARPALTPDAVKRILMRSARAFPTSGAASAVTNCQGPSSNSTQDECYCTTSTCGAGMLDASAAVAQSVSDGVSVVGVSPSQPTAADTIVLSGASSLPSALGSNITSYQWELVDGGGIVTSLSGSLTASSVTAKASGAGRFQVRLTVTDDVNATAVTTQTVIVEAAPSSSGGGGGALDDLSLVLGLLLVLATWGIQRKH